MELQELFKEREDQILQEAGRIAREVARKEMALLEFELFCEVMVPEESKQRAEDAVKRLREERWKKALMKAHGDEEQALLVYDA